MSSWYSYQHQHGDGGRQSAQQWWQRSGQQPTQQQQPQHTSNVSWTCRVCQYTNLGKARVCKGCNVRRAFAEQYTGDVIATQSPEAHNTNSVPAQLGTVAHLLQGNLGTTPATVTDTSNQDLRAQYIARVTKLEAALAHLPAEQMYAGPRQNIMEEIQSVKKIIAELNPLPVRLGNRLQALTRARERVQQTQLAVETASQAFSAAQSEAQQLEKEVADLERQIAAPHIPASPKNCLVSLQSGMQRVLEEMSSSSQVPPDAIASTRTQMDALFSGLSNLSAMLCMSQQQANQQMQQAQPQQIHMPMNAMHPQQFAGVGGVSPCTPNRYAMTPAVVPVQPFVYMQMQQGAAGARNLDGAFSSAANASSAMAVDVSVPRSPNMTAGA